MAEIKSSIELAMERTQGLTFTEEERRRLEVERQQRAAKALVSQYLRGEMGLAELDRKKRESTDVASRALERAMVEALGLGQEALPRALEALESWLGKRQRTALQRLRDLSLQWGQAVQKRRRKIKAELREKLARRGVEGSAVEPHVEGSPLWDRAMEELRVQFAANFQEVQDRLMAALAEAD